MPVGTVKSSVANIPDLLARARAIAELARERAQRTEAERRVGEDMIERMRQADLFRVMQPRAYGGFEYGFDVFAQIVAAHWISRMSYEAKCEAVSYVIEKSKVSR